MTKSEADPFRYTWFGLRVLSEIALPELGPGFRLEAAAPAGVVSQQVTISRGAIPMRPPPDTHSQWHIYAARHAAVVAVVGVGRFQVRRGEEIVVDAESGAAAPNIRAIIIGPVFSLLCHQRGLLPLHANAILFDGRAIAFAGRSGAGKSTLAAYLENAGHDVLCDDISLVSFDADRPPMVWAGPPEVRLWRDAASSLGYDSGALEHIADGMDKFRVPLRRRAVNQAFPLESLYVLEPPQAELDIRRLNGASAYHAIAAQTHLNQHLVPMDLHRQHHAQIASVLKNTSVFSVNRFESMATLATGLHKLENHFRKSDIARRLEAAEGTPS